MSRILVVDESAAIRASLRDILEEDGYDVSLAANGQDAMAQAAVSRPDVALLDIEMPEMDGIDVLLALKAKKETHGVSVIMLTSHDRDDKVVGALEVGATDFIPKPFSAAIVRARVRNVIRIRSRHRKVQAATEAKAQFLADMSHEIRTPMSAILGYAELLGEETDLSLVGRERIDTVIRNGHHLTSIINAILDVSKIEAGKMTVESRPCSVPELLADIASLMRARASEKGLDFRLWVEGDVPLTIHSDPTCIRQILVNLVGNAVKFTEKGSVRVVASMTGTSEKPMIRFRVIDTGIGFTPDQEKRLFNAFTQADETMTRRFGGTGLGLTISKGLAQLLGGDIVVQSELNKGSEFVVELETGEIDGVEHFQNADEAIRTIQCDQPTSKALPTNLTGRILLVEDGLDNQRLIAFLLRKSGLEVSVAENGAVGRSHALDAWQKGRPFDVVLMDMQMPVLDGYQATAKLRDEGYDGPVVALTAHAMSHDRAKCLAAGCDDFLTKPVDRHHLIETISRWLKADKGASPDACQPTS